MNVLHIFLQGDAVTRGVGLLLLAMSVGTWVVILWKGGVLSRARRGIARSTAAFWQARTLDDARVAVQAFDHEQWIQPLIEATRLQQTDTLAAAGDLSQQLTRVLRDALHGVLIRLQAGQVLLATVGATSPFVGLLGTVWGIYHALMGLTGGGQVSIDQLSGPVGEALVMTAIGLTVAIPAVLAYNILGRSVARIEADLEGFALDLRELMLTAPADKR